METEITKTKPECSKYNRHRFIRSIFYRVRNFINWLFNTELGVYCLLTVMAFIWAIVYLYAILEDMARGY